MSNPVQTLTIAAKNLDIPAELIVPADSAVATEDGAHRPALVVLHDHYGLDDSTRSAAARLSELGYITLTPNLYARSGGPKDTGSEVAIANFTQTLSDSALIADALAAFTWLLSKRMWIHNASACWVGAGAVVTP